MRLLAVISLVTSVAATQGVLPIAGSYRFGTIVTEYDSNCTPPNPAPEVTVSRGTAMLGIDGRFVFSATDYVLCPNGQTQTSPDAGSGLYFVGDDGRLTFDDDGAVPGLEPFTLFLRADASAAATTRKLCDNAAELFVMVALGSGHSNASLNGAYHVTRLVVSSGAAHTVRGELGLIVFNGAGSYTESGNRRSLALGGVVASAPYNSNDSYPVAADGALATNAGGWGAVTPDRELFFWVRSVGSQVELTVGVRQGNGYGNRLVNGRWGTSRLDHDIGSAAPIRGALRTEYGTLDLTATGTALQWDFERVETRPSSLPFCDRIAATGAFTLSQTGSLRLSPSGGAAPIDVGVSGDGSLFVGSTAEPGSVGMTVGVSRCAWPRRFGRPTPGSGGFAPSLSSFGGFPHAGNSAFTLVTTGGLGGAPGAVLVSLADAPGIPYLGGTLWLDPTQVVLQFPLVLSGPAGLPGVGAAGVFLPLPASPSVAGARLVSQAFVVDPRAPGNVSMTHGLDVVIVR